MTTTSETDLRGPEGDNHGEYLPPPVAEKYDPSSGADLDGWVLEEEDLDITYDEDGNEVFGSSIVEEEV